MIFETQACNDASIQQLYATEWQSYRVTESQTPKGTQYTGGWNFFCVWFQWTPLLASLAKKSSTGADPLFIQKPRLHYSATITCKLLGNYKEQIGNTVPYNYIKNQVMFFVLKHSKNDKGKTKWWFTVIKILE